MPRLTVSTPKDRHHRASGQAVVTIAGTDRYLGPWKSRGSIVEYDRLVGEWLAAGRPTALPAAAHQLTVAELLASFWRFCQGHYKKHGRETGTAATYKRIMSLIRAKYGHTLAENFGPLSLKAIQLHLLKEGRSRLYINDDVRRIQRIFKWAASEQLIGAAVSMALDTVEGIQKGRTSAREYEVVLPVDDATVDATLPHLSPIVADMIRLQRLTGARPGEVVILRPGDIDRSHEVWKFIPAEHKTEHHNVARTIFIGPKAQAVLAPYLLRASDAYCFSPKEAEKKRRVKLHENRATPLSCGNVPGSNRRRRIDRPLQDRYTGNSYRRAIYRGCELAFNMPRELREIPTKRYDRAAKKWAIVPAAEREELQRKAAEWRAAHAWTPHQLRHAAATEIRAKFGLEAVQVSLGHTNMKTSEIYTAKNHELAARVAKEVG